jgi:hypothetical protein
MELVAYLSLANQIKAFIPPFLPPTAPVMIDYEDCRNSVGSCREVVGPVYPWTSRFASRFFGNSNPKRHFLTFILILELVQL